MKKSLIIISLLISGIFAEDYAGLSGSFMRLGITARSIAMGIMGSQHFIILRGQLF